VVELCRRQLQSTLAAYWAIAAFCSAAALLFLCIPSPQNPHAQKQQQGGAAAGEAAAGEAGEAAAAGSSGAAGHNPFQGRSFWFAIVPIFMLIWTCVGTEVSAAPWASDPAGCQAGAKLSPRPLPRCMPSSAGSQACARAAAGC
jgi:hypothetical protein